jgi:predicted enzyme related to lactoylglutathione lyase
MSKILKSFEGFTIWSGDYKNLAKWYEEVLELKRVDEVDIPGDQVISFEVQENSEMRLWIGQHSEVKGKNKDPFRQMISYIVDDVFEVAKILKDKKVEIIGGPDISPTGDIYFLTARDPELNLIQMFSFKK